MAALLFFRIWQSDHVTVNSSEFGNINTVMSEVLTVNDGATNSLIEYNYVHDSDGIAISSWSGPNNFFFIGNKVEYIGIKRDGTVWYNNPAVAIYNDGGYWDPGKTGHNLYFGSNVVRPDPQFAAGFVRQQHVVSNSSNLRERNAISHLK